VSKSGQTLVMVPIELMPTIRALIARHDQDESLAP
jgi:hypothetical protein